MPLANRGFTLIEILVALMIFAVIAIAGYRGLDSVMQTRTHIELETRKWQQLSSFFLRMEQDVAQAVHRPVRDSGGTMQQEWIGHPVVVGDDDAELVFTRTGGLDSNGSNLPPQRIGYRFQDGNIFFLRWPFPDQALRARPTRYSVLEGVREFHLRYMDVSGTWYERWPLGQLSTQPAALEVAVTLVEGEKITRKFALQ